MSQTQVKLLQKRPKDRFEQKLLPDDIVHYWKRVTALDETIRLMADVDEAFESAGGWPVK